MVSGCCWVLRSTYDLYISSTTAGLLYALGYSLWLSKKWMACFLAGAGLTLKISIHSCELCRDRRVPGYYEHTTHRRGVARD
jgi:hypothetical protein